MSLASRSLALLSCACIVAFADRGSAQERSTATECERAFSGTQLSMKAGHPLDARNQASACIQVCPDFARTTCLRWRQDAEQAIPSVLFAVEGATDAVIYIDEMLVSDHLDGLAHELEPGPHRFAAKPTSFPMQTQKLVVLEGVRRQLVSFHFQQPVQPASRSVHPMVWIGGGIAVAGGIVGTTAGLFATRNASTVRANCADQLCPPPFHADLDALQTSATVSTIAFALAGAGLAAFTIGWLMPSQPKKPLVGVTF
jgi:hypothetical protein